MQSPDSGKSILVNYTKAMTTEQERSYYYLITNDDIPGLESAFEKNSDSCEVAPYGQSLVLHAVLENKLEVLRFLLEQGCDVNKPDDSGLTPLHAAAETNNIEAAKALLDAGAHVEAENKFGNTPLFKAVYAYSGNLSILSLLLEHDANPFHKNKDGVSPYDFAKQIRIEEVINIFEGNQRGNI